ncbi:unnamed protein product [Mytilus coruscus]|uniref:EF-hand domain-containing protein n=1 Tax=Mytilus coruscus TaxID=42192 RepID=A0A6J8D1P6_MYTCO|nr:unnamed protein product [Mytilus coruscus]
MASDFTEDQLEGNEGIDYEEFLELLSDAMRQQCTDDDYEEVFNVYDSDGNGIISSDEFRAAMNSMGENLSKEEAEEMIMEADSDGDGQIDLAGRKVMVLSNGLLKVHGI